MGIRALELLNEVRLRLDDMGGDRGAPSAGYYARWQEDDAPCLWKNVELSRYLLETIRELGIRQPIIDDAFTLSLQAGLRQYALDQPPILRIESITRASDGEPVLKTTLGEIQHVARWYRDGRGYLKEDGRRTLMEDATHTHVLDWRTTTGWPTHYLLDERSGYLSVYPAPVAGFVDTLRMIVQRGYATNFTWAAIARKATPFLELDELPEYFHDALVAGVCARAFRRRDSDTFSRELAADCAAEFNWRAGPPKSFAQLDARARWAGGICEVVPNARFFN